MSAMTDRLTLYNTQTKRAEPFAPADPSRVTFYSCGPTVYDDAHIGNFRSFLAADLLRRFIESPLCTVTDDTGRAHAGPRTVQHVMNITDVGHMTDDGAADGGGEDKMAVAGQRLLEAKKAGTIPAGVEIDPDDPRQIADYFARRFIEDGKKLGLKVATEQGRDASLMPRASDHVGGMRAVISALLDNGSAYAAGTPGSRAVYFSVRTFESYGSLSGNTLENIRGGAGGRVSTTNQSDKKHPADFLLWKEDESHLMKWPAPDHTDCTGWGMGYPGWHIECTAMSLGRLIPGGLGRILEKPGSGAEIDLHSGGEDNIFPHHECERAQSCALTGGERFARHWFHARFLRVEGQKMSKSAGTFHTPRDLFKLGHEPAAVRLELIKTHYRANADFSMEGLKSSAARIARWRRTVQRLVMSIDDRTKIRYEHPKFTDDLCSQIRAALQDDLNIAEAIGLLDKACSQSGGQYNKEDEALTYGLELPDTPLAVAIAKLQFSESDDGSDQKKLAAIHLIDNVLGVIFAPAGKIRESALGVFLPGVEPEERVERLLIERAGARKNKDFARADAIRDELAGMGLTIKDAAGGKVEVGRA